MFNSDIIQTFINYNVVVCICIIFFKVFAVPTYYFFKMLTRASPNFDSCILISVFGYFLKLILISKSWWKIEGFFFPNKIEGMIYYFDPQLDFGINFSRIKI